MSNIKVWTDEERAKNLMRLTVELREANSFDDNPTKIAVPWALAESIINTLEADKKVDGAVPDNFKIDGKIAVIYTVELAIELFKRGYENITVLTKKYCKHTKFLAQQMNFKYNTINEATNMTKKFNVALTNPPYKQGLFRTFMQIGLEDLLTDDGVMIQVSPDDTKPFNNKNYQSVPLMKKYGLQTLENVHDQFETNLGTNTPIMAYYFDKAKTYNPDVFTLTANEQMAMNIVDKITAKVKQVGALFHGAVGNTPEKGNHTMVRALKTIHQDGPVFEDLPMSEVRYIENGEDYYYVGRFYGKSAYNHAYKGTGPLYIHKDKLLVIGNVKSHTEDEFNAVMNLSEIKFALNCWTAGSRATKGWGLSKLPVVPAGTTSDDNWFGLTDEEQAFVKTHEKGIV